MELIATTTIDSNTVIFGENIIKSGVFEWAIKINHITKSGNSHSPWMGIIEDNKNVMDGTRKDGSWQSNGYLFCGGRTKQLFPYQIEELAMSYGIWLRWFKW